MNIIEVYNKIAPHFDKTRFSHWKKVKEFVLSLPPNSYVADIGCGNGKNMQIRNDLQYIGVDASKEFCTIVNKKNIKCIEGNILNIPLEINSVDHTICVAVIHHLDNELDRLQSIRELIRITKPNGLIFIQVWMNQDENQKQDRYIKWYLNKKYSEENKEECLYRFYHHFNKDELENMVNNFNIEVIESFIDNGDNYGVVIRKL